MHSEAVHFQTAFSMVQYSQFIHFMSSVSKDMTAMYSTVHGLNVMSVERYKYYVQYSTWVKCRECRKIQVLCTVQYMG